MSVASDESITESLKLCACINTQTHTHTHKYTQIHTHTHTNTRTHKYTHTHTHRFTARRVRKLIQKYEIVLKKDKKVNREWKDGRMKERKQGREE